MGQAVYAENQSLKIEKFFISQNYFVTNVSAVMFTTGQNEYLDIYAYEVVHVSGPSINFIVSFTQNDTGVTFTPASVVAPQNGTQILIRLPPNTTVRYVTNIVNAATYNVKMVGIKTKNSP